MTFFQEKFPFPRPKFLMTFLVNDHVFEISQSFSRFPTISTVLNIIYVPFFTRKPPILENNSLMTPFLLCFYFRAHQTTLLFKILGRRMHGPSPASNLGGPSPQFP